MFQVREYLVFPEFIPFNLNIHIYESEDQRNNKCTTDIAPALIVGYRRTPTPDIETTEYFDLQNILINKTARPGYSVGIVGDM